MLFKQVRYLFQYLKKKEQNHVFRLISRCRAYQTKRAARRDVTRCGAIPPETNLFVFQLGMHTSIKLVMSLHKHHNLWCLQFFYCFSFPYKCSFLTFPIKIVYYHIYTPNLTAQFKQNRVVLSVKRQLIAIASLSMVPTYTKGIINWLRDSRWNERLLSLLV